MQNIGQFERVDRAAHDAAPGAKGHPQIQAPGHPHLQIVVAPPEYCAAPLAEQGEEIQGHIPLFWAVCVLDGMRWENHGVGDFVYALCKNFVDFDWQLQKVVVSAANQISLQPKGAP